MMPVSPGKSSCQSFIIYFVQDFLYYAPFDL